MKFKSLFFLVILITLISSCQPSKQEVVESFLSYDINELNDQEKLSLIKQLSELDSSSTASLFEKDFSVIKNAANWLDRLPKIAVFIYEPKKRESGLEFISDPIGIDAAKSTVVDAYRGVLGQVDPHNLRGKNGQLKFWPVDRDGLIAVLDKSGWFKGKYEGLAFYPSIDINHAQPYHSLVFGPIDNLNEANAQYDIINTAQFYNFVEPCPDFCGTDVASNACTLLEYNVSRRSCN